MDSQQLPHLFSAKGAVGSPPQNGFAVANLGEAPQDPITTSINQALTSVMSGIENTRSTESPFQRLFITIEFLGRCPRLAMRERRWR
jgi:hypothetical protein